MPQRLEDLFDRFDPVPLGSGCIAQVHLATLRTPPGTGLANGLQVAVKVRRPGVVDTMRRYA
jgi:aarF domain-containing kinase